MANSLDEIVSLLGEVKEGLSFTPVDPDQREAHRKAIHALNDVLGHVYDLRDAERRGQ